MREIDRLIAEKVMKYSNVTPKGNISEVNYYSFQKHPWSKKPEYKYTCRIRDFKPSWRIEDAWKVVETLEYDIKVTKHIDCDKRYQVHVFKPGNIQMVFAKTLPDAICLAALKSVGLVLEGEE